MRLIRILWAKMCADWYLMWLALRHGEHCAVYTAQNSKGKIITIAVISLDTGTQAGNVRRTFYGKVDQADVNELIEQRRLFWRNMHSHTYTKQQKHK